MPGQHWGERDGKQPSRLETVVFGVIGGGRGDRTIHGDAVLLTKEIAGKYTTQATERFTIPRRVNPARDVAGIECPSALSILHGDSGSTFSAERREHDGSCPQTRLQRLCLSSGAASRRLVVPSHVRHTDAQHHSYCSRAHRGCTASLLYP
jgi:hypothetical protein